MKKLWVMMAVVAIAGALAATSGIGLVQDAIFSLCSSLKSLLPIASMLMVVVAGVIYAAGQLMGAETRARANVWATAALTGALIGLLIYAIAPPVLQMIYAPSGTQIAC